MLTNTDPPTKIFKKKNRNEKLSKPRFYIKYIGLAWFMQQLQKTSYTIIFIKTAYILKIILVGAHTSTNSFLSPLITQWYWKLSVTFVQVWRDDILLQFFFKAALSHSVLEVGQDSTISKLSTDSWQYTFWFVHRCCGIEFAIIFFKTKNPQMFHSFKIHRTHYLNLQEN